MNPSPSEVEWMVLRRTRESSNGAGREGRKTSPEDPSHPRVGRRPGRHQASGRISNVRLQLLAKLSYRDLERVLIHPVLSFGKRACAVPRFAQKGPPR